MKTFNINVWYRYGRDHDETDFVPEQITAENAETALNIVSEKYKATKINPFKIELSN